MTTVLTKKRTARRGDRRMSRVRDNVASGLGAEASSTYLVRVRDTSVSRRQAFAAFVRKALADARTIRMWNGSEVARRTGVSRQTINRWVRGDWQSDPEPERVVAFCEGLGLDPSVAFTILEWGRPAAVEPAALDPDIAALLRRWADPNLTEQERFHIRETVRYLAYRPGEQRHAS